MATQSPVGLSGIVRFGAYELDIDAGELRRGGIRVRTEGQPLRVLRLLVESGGELVSREELRRALAPGAQFGDLDHLVNVAVAKLRVALGDSAGVPRFIETIPRRGYRFIYPVTSQPPEPVAPATETAPAQPREVVTPAASRSRGWLHKFTLVAAVVAIVLLFTTGRWGHPKPTTPEPRVRVETSLDGIEYMPAISPDGKLVSFLWIVPTRPYPDLYVKMTGAEKMVRLTQDGAGSSAWSPDSTMVAAIVCHAAQSCDLELFPALGGTPRVLAPIRLELARAEKTRLTFSHDGYHIAYPQPVENGAYAIQEIDIRTGAVRAMTQPAAGTAGDFSPAYSPDGKRIAFLRASDGEFNVAVQDVMGGSPVLLTQKAIASEAVDWTPDGTQLVVASGRRLWMLDARTPGEMEPARFNSEGATVLSVSVSGRLVFARFDPQNVNIWRLPLKAEQAQPKIAITSSRAQTKPDISPDGKEVAFVSDRTGTRELWKCSSDGKNCLQLSQTAAAGLEPSSPRWSRDGKEIAYSAHSGGHSRIYVMGGNGDHASALTDGDGDDVAPFWAPNGEWLYFGSNRSGTWEIWKIKRSGADATRVTLHGGYIPGIAADGTLVYAKGESDPDLWIRKSDGTEEQILRRAQVTPPDAWAITGSDVYLYEATDRASPELQVINLLTRKVRTVARVDVPRAGVQGTRPAVSKDGSYALVPVTAPNQCDLVLVEPFR